jgi:hypothetical protein
MIPGSYAVCTIAFDDPDSDAATYRVVKWGYDTAEDAFRISTDSGSHRSTQRRISSSSNTSIVTPRHEKPIA